jgi:hypothetical protein
VEANANRSNYASIQPPPEEDDDVPPSPHAMIPFKYCVSAYPVQASQMTNNVNATTSTDKKSSTKRSAARSLASLSSKKKICNNLPWNINVIIPSQALYFRTRSKLRDK